MARAGHNTKRAQRKPAIARNEGATPVELPKSAVRTCVACRQPVARADLARLVTAPDGSIAVDANASLAGRGAWIHPTRACIAMAAKRHAAERSLKVPVRDIDTDALVAGVRGAMNRKLGSLVSVAQRKGVIGVGAMVTSDMLGRQNVSLVLVASDAGETSKALGEEQESRPGRGGSGNGHVRVVGTKSELGALLGRGEVAVLAITDPGIAQELVATIDRIAGLEG